MNVSAAGGSREPVIGSSGSQQAGNIGLDRDAFLQLLVTQMRYQDPLSGGQDPSAFILQLSLLTILEQLIKVNQSLEESKAVANQTHALSLLNREVLVDHEGEYRVGMVSAVRHGPSGTLVTIGELEYPLEKIVMVQGGLEDGETAESGD